MSNETYWLNKSDAEFVRSIVEKYGNTTKPETEQEIGTDSNDPVYEITMIRHERNIALDDDLERGNVTLRSALLSDAKHQSGLLLETGSWEGSSGDPE